MGLDLYFPSSLVLVLLVLVLVLVLFLLWLLLWLLLLLLLLGWLCRAESPCKCLLQIGAGTHGRRQLMGHEATT